MIAKLRRWLRPFCGEEIRRLVAAITLAVALPRLPVWPSTPAVQPLQLLPQEAFGWITLVAGLALLATSGHWRLRVVGRLTALMVFSVWALLAAAATSSTSILIDLLIMYALLGEIMVLRHAEC